MEMENASDNLEEFCERIRDFVFNKSKSVISAMLNVTPDSLPEVDQYVSFEETKQIVEESIKNNVYTNVSHKNVIEICNNLNKRIFNNLFSRLAAEGYLDCAWSEADDSFLFKVSKLGIERGITLPRAFKL